MCEYQFEFERLYDLIDEARKERDEIKKELNEIKEERDKLKNDYEILKKDYEELKEESSLSQTLLQKIEKNCLYYKDLNY
jgi:uncharacterized coiled-coil DUF342 family protein